MSGSSDARRRVLAFGDSNTYGWMPVSTEPPSRRFPEAERWPGAMRAALGAGYEVVEDGLSGRTTDATDPSLPHITGAGMDGCAALPASLAIHLPLDLVIIMLGTNDLKAMFARSPFRIALGAGRLIDTVRATAGGVATDYAAPRVLLMAPPPLGAPTVFADAFVAPEAPSRALAGLYAGIARLAGAAFFDAGSVIGTDGADALHFTAASHLTLGRAVARVVRSILEPSAPP